MKTSAKKPTHTGLIQMYSCACNKKKLINQCKVLLRENKTRWCVVSVGWCNGWFPKVQKNKPTHNILIRMSPWEGSSSWEGSSPEFQYYLDLNSIRLITVEDLRPSLEKELRLSMLALDQAHIRVKEANLLLDRTTKRNKEAMKVLDTLDRQKKYN